MIHSIQIGVSISLFCTKRYAVGKIVSNGPLSTHNLCDHGQLYLNQTWIAGVSACPPDPDYFSRDSVVDVQGTDYFKYRL